jgi:hypothetical protein
LFRGFILGFILAVVPIDKTRLGWDTNGYLWKYIHDSILAVKEYLLEEKKQNFERTVFKIKT